MPQRLGYKKSRAGCNQCKKRRVKCDEAKPSCTACLRHGQRCSFLLDSPGDSPRTQSPRRKSRSVSQANEEIAPSDSTPYSLEDLLLLHHYTTETATTFSRSPDIRDAWMKAIPSFAANAEYVMQATLAVAAIHKVSLNPQENAHLNSVAIRYLNRALALSRPHMLDITEEHAPAIFALAALISVFSLAQPLYDTSEQMLSKPIDQLLDAVKLINGSKSVINNGCRPAPDSALRPIMYLTATPDYAKIPEVLKVELNWVFKEIESIKDESAFNACTQAISELERVIALVLGAAPSLEMGLALRWIAIVTPDYISLLKERSPPALIILALYSAILVEPAGGWLFGSWSRRLRGEILEVTHGTHWGRVSEALPAIDREFETLFTG